MGSHDSIALDQPLSVLLRKTSRESVVTTCAPGANTTSTLEGVEITCGTLLMLEAALRHTLPPSIEKGERPLQRSAPPPPNSERLPFPSWRVMGSARDYAGGWRTRPPHLLLRPPPTMIEVTGSLPVLGTMIGPHPGVRSWIPRGSEDLPHERITGRGAAHVRAMSVGETREEQKTLTRPLLVGESGLPTSPPILSLPMSQP